MHWIIGTAGHIDHGKTSLVKALTGTDTDRLKEEKERGISIDLGFASLDLPDGIRAGIVDVPGHERFIRNMLAGAHGIDVVLFTVAADDGVMPQTEEHFDIVQLLGVRKAVFVVTKADLATQLRLAEVANEIRTLVAGTALEGSPIVRFALPTEAGLDEVRAELVRTLRSSDKPTPRGRFRLPVDRAFTSAGHGLIVTGTAISGEVHLGDRVRCLPSGAVLRVRSVEVHGEPVDVARWGQRIALNLAGSVQTAITRGDVVGDEALTLTCDRFDAAFEVRRSAPGGVKDHQRVRLHLGTAERIGKIIPLGSREHPGEGAIEPGGRGFCQVTLTAPIAAMRGDRFILRDETAQRTLGGGIVLLPAAPRRRRADPAVLQVLESLSGGEDGPLFEALVADRAGRGEFTVSLAAMAQWLNDVEEHVADRARAVSGLHSFTLDGDTSFATERACADVKARLLDAVGAWHAAQPLSPGVDIEEVRAAIPGRPPARIFRLLVDELERDRAIVREGNLLRLPSHRIRISGPDRSIVDRIASALEASPLAPPDVKQLAADLGLDRPRLLPLLKAMEKQQQVVAIAADLYFSAAAVSRVREEIGREFADGRPLSTAAFRDRYQTSRKYAIPLLEYLDRTGVTVRIGDARRLKAAVRNP